MSKFAPLNIHESSEAQRRQFATEFLQLELPANATDNDVVSAIGAANGGSDTIFVVVEEPASEVDQTGQPPLPPEAEDTGDRMAGSLGHSDPKVRIMIPNAEGDGKTITDDVAVGVNGVAWQIKRGAEVDIPYRVYEALRAAVTDAVTHDGEGEVHVNKVQRFNFNTISMPSAAEVAAYRERVRDIFCP